MAIAGLLVETLPKHIADVEKKISNVIGMTSYGIHQERFVVVVAEFPSADIEKAVDAIKSYGGVLSIYTTYITLEDEAATS